MERIEARRSLPLNPIEQTSSLSATSSRAPQSTPFSEALSRMSEVIRRPRLDDAVIIDITRRELSKQRNSLPQEAVFTNQVLKVAVPGMDNAVKDQRLQELLPEGVRSRRIPEAEEAHALDVVVDAYSKAKSAAQIAETKEDLRREARKGELITLGVDVLTVPFVEENNELTYKRFGKPQSEEEVYNLFVYARGLLQRGKVSAYPYITEVATVIHNPYYPNRDAVSVQQATVFLSPELVAYLATPEGFAQYSKRAKEILNNLHQTGAEEKSILNTSGGTVIEAFRDLPGGITGIITGVDQLTPANISSLTLDKAAYAEAEKIAQGHADENLIRDYCQRFQRPNNLLQNNYQRAESN